MKEIFTDLYRKVLGFFQTQEKENSESKKDAVNRMRLVLMQDRTNLTPYLLERMRGEMIDVLAKYVEMDKEALELNFEQEGEQVALMLSIPVVRAKDEDEIKAVLDAEDEAKANAEAEENSEVIESENVDAPNEDEAEADAEPEAESDSEKEETSEPKTDETVDSEIDGNMEIQNDSDEKTADEKIQPETENIEEKTTSTKKRFKKIKE